MQRHSLVAVVGESGVRPLLVDRLPEEVSSHADLPFGALDGDQSLVATGLYVLNCDVGLRFIANFAYSLTPRTFAKFSYII